MRHFRHLLVRKLNDLFLLVLVLLLIISIPRQGMKCRKRTGLELNARPAVLITILICSNQGSGRSRHGGQLLRIKTAIERGRC
jgi:hypothetical protein